MADEETIIINGLKVTKLRGTCNYRSWIASLQRALEIPDPEMWRLITGQKPEPGNDPVFLFLKSEEFERLFVAEKRGVPLEAVNEQDVNGYLADLGAGRKAVEHFEDKTFYEWLDKTGDASKLLRSTISDYIEYDLDPDLDPDSDHCSGYFDQLQGRYGPTGYLDIHERWNEWTFLRYDGTNRDDREQFVSRFKEAKVKVDQALVSPIEPRFELIQFLSAISGRPECEDLLTCPPWSPLKLHQMKDDKDMEAVYKRFIHYERPRYTFDG